MSVIVDHGLAPGAHVLIVGASSYRHLPGGDGPLAEQTLGLKQVSPPRHSARLFAEWWLTRYSNPNVPLASLELLISPAGKYELGTAGEHSVEAATRPNLDAAFARWYARCESDAGNLAVFYFCGHGVQRENLTLLLEDFGANANSPFAGSFQYDDTWQAMASCRVASQVYLIDACREVNSTLLGQLHVNSTPLKDAKYEHPYQQTVHQIHSTAMASQAFGPLSGAPTYFTKAMVEALDGPGATSFEMRKWVVTPDSLFRGIQHLMARSPVAKARDQHPTHTGSSIQELYLQHLAEPPLVPLRVSWNPMDAAADGELHLIHKWYPGVEYDRAPGPGIWEHEIAAGVYDVSPLFPSGRFRAVIPNDGFNAEPPALDWTVEAT